MSKNTIAAGLRHAVAKTRREISGIAGSNTNTRITIAEAELAASEIDRLADALEASEQDRDRLAQAVSGIDANRWYYELNHDCHHLCDSTEWQAVEAALVAEPKEHTDA